MNTCENYAVVLDLDRTLLKDDHTIGELTKKTLLEFKKQGGKIIIATGRAIARSKKYMDEINVDGLVALNGSVSYIKEDMIAQTPINKELVYDMIQRILSIGDVFMSLAYPTRMITNNPKFAVPGVNDFTDFKEFSLDEIQKLNIFTSKGKELLAIDFSSYGCKVLTNDANPEYFVVTQSDVNKMTGLLPIFENLGINKENAISFGDDYNDIEMLEECGIGVVMANGAEDVKTKGNYITEDNNNDGVGKWLNEYFHLLNK